MAQKVCGNVAPQPANSQEGCTNVHFNWPDDNMYGKHQKSRLKHQDTLHP